MNANTLRALSVILAMCSLFAGCGKDGSPSADTDAGNVTIFAAASTNNCISEMARSISAQKNINCDISAASSGTLAQQLTRGAKCDVYISASRKWMKYLIDEKIADPQHTFSMASNKLVIVTSDRKIAAMSPDKLAEKIPQILGNKEFLAIGDPSHVPAGKYAKQALESLGLWESLRGRMSFEANVTAVLQKAATGAAKLGIVYLSDIQQTDSVVKLCVIDKSLHSPIEYYCAVINPQNVAAEEFVNYLFSPCGSGFITRSGFVSQDRRYAFRSSENTSENQ